MCWWVAIHRFEAVFGEEFDAKVQRRKDAKRRRRNGLRLSLLASWRLGVGFRAGVLAPMCSTSLPSVIGYRARCRLEGIGAADTSWSPAQGRRSGRWGHRALYLGPRVCQHRALSRRRSGGGPCASASQERLQPRRARLLRQNGCLREPFDETGRRLSLQEACAFGHVHQRHVLDLDVVITDGERSVRARVVCVPFGGEDRYYLPHRRMRHPRSLASRRPPPAAGAPFARAARGHRGCRLSESPPANARPPRAPQGSPDSSAISMRYRKFFADEGDVGGE